MTTNPKRRERTRTGGASSGLAETTETRAMQLRVERARRDGSVARYLLRLYVTGTTPASARAIERVRSFCEEHLQDRYDLEVIDIYQLPVLAKDDQIIATPTLIKVLPAPLRRFIGDLSRIENVLFGMDVRERR
jgi:circadian clock protein KaiB